MQIFGRRKKKQQEERTFDATNEQSWQDNTDMLLRALLKHTTITKKEALNIPSLNGCIEYISNTISMLPIRLYEEIDGKITEVKRDNRIRLLNDDTGDTLDAAQFWKALVSDYFLGKGGYAYIAKQRNQCKGLYYVNEEDIFTNKNTDPIFKDYNILIRGQMYKPFEFIKILRKTKDGCEGISVLEEAQELMEVCYSTLIFEKALVTKGGNKKGFLKAARKLTGDAITELKNSWKNLYSNNEENVVILNDGVEFRESSNTSVEMQLNENKEANSSEMCKIFNVPESIIKGTATERDYINGFKLAVMPVLRVIECAINRDFLLESEKTTMYWAFDAKELTKGDIKTRYEAYKMAIDANFMQPDEARYLEDWEPLGLDFIKLSLDSVLYNPKTKEIYTPNTNQTQKMDNLKGGDKNESGNQS